MKKLVVIILSILFILNGCSNKTISPQKLSIPKIDIPDIPFLEKYKVDQTLPTTDFIKATPSMTEISLSWKGVDYPKMKGYRVLKYNNKIKGFVVIKTINDKYKTSYIDRHLKPKTTYYYKISTFTTDKRVSPASKTKVVTTIYNLKPITNLNTKDGNYLPRKIKLNWDPYPQKELIKEYKMQRSENGRINWKIVGTIYDSTATEYIDNSVKDGVPYFYRIYGITYQNIKTPYSNTAKGISKPLPLPIEPKNIMIVNNQARNIKLSWVDPNILDKSRTIVKYNIYTSIYPDTLFIKHDSTTKKYYIDKINEDGKVVYYKITAVDNFGLESPLPKKAIKGYTRANSKAPIITEYKIIDNKVIITWRPPTRDMKKYVVIKRYLTKFLFPKTEKIIDIYQTKFIDPNIKPGYTYHYEIYGIDSYGVRTKTSRQISIKIK